METIELIAITMDYEGKVIELGFEKAELIVISEYGSRLWYANVDGIADSELLRRFGQSENIGIELNASAKDGRKFRGSAYLHPNEPHQAAAIRGDGELHMS
ncbi:hypothetical protein [Paenibacillus sp. NPDC058071]|uniref:hypothetical protein n=1 Tax=Paenibacillus sp. NPDC058071 TaxID=3346326 RepID=UPI0036D7ADEA